MKRCCLCDRAIEKDQQCCPYCEESLEMPMVIAGFPVISSKTKKPMKRRDFLEEFCGQAKVE